MPWRSKGTWIWQHRAEKTKANDGEKLTLTFTVYTLGNNESPPNKVGFHNINKVL